MDLILKIILIGIGLAMDAFAVSLAKGMCLTKIKVGFANKIAFVFGFFQFAMIIIGWLAGTYILHYFQKFSFIVPIILIALGLNMLKEAFSNEEKEEACIISLKALIPLGFATSMDALAVGIGFSFLNTPVILSSIIVGIVTFVISFIGFILGTALGAKVNSKFAEILGAVILIGIGIFEFFK
ncbi:MAG: manganese efflux pump MntP family protein [Sarcina sp.]